MAGVPGSTRRAATLLRSLTNTQCSFRGIPLGLIPPTAQQLSSIHWNRCLVGVPPEHSSTYSPTVALADSVQPFSWDPRSLSIKGSPFCGSISTPWFGRAASSHQSASRGATATATAGLPSDPPLAPQAHPHTIGSTAFSRHASSAPAVDPTTGTQTPPQGIQLSKGTRGQLKKIFRPATPPPTCTTFDGRLRKDNREAVGYSVLAHDLTAPAVSVEAAEEDDSSGADVDREEQPGDVVKPELSAQVPVEVKKKGVFAVVQVGSHQFKVTPGDVIYTEKLLFADINQRVNLEKVLMLGSRSETVVGRPTVKGAAVEALVEEQALAAKVIVFKKKRRKNYRRHNGHRQELTRLRVLDIVGMEE